MSTPSAHEKLTERRAGPATRAERPPVADVARSVLCIVSSSRPRLYCVPKTKMGPMQAVPTLMSPSAVVWLGMVRRILLMRAE